MGAWGMEPKDNDDAGDLFDRVPAASAKEMNKLYRGRPRYASDRWARLGALQMFIEGMPIAVGHLDSSTLRGAEEDVDVLLGAEDWLEEWRFGSQNNTPAVIANLKKFAKMLRHIQSKR